MFLPANIGDTNQEAMVDTWLGYNHNYRIGAGEWWDMENLSSDGFPLMTPRKRRAKLIEAQKVRGILHTEDTLVYLEGSTLHFGSRTYDLSGYDLGDDDQTLVRFGAYILLFPSGVYVNLFDSDDEGTMAASYTVPQGVTITYTMCDYDGNDFANIVYGNYPPDNPTDGMYWLNTNPEEAGLNIWVESLSMWQPVATTYIRIDIPGSSLTSHFSEGDTITMNSVLQDINAGSTIQKIGEQYMVIIGLLPNGVVFHETTDDIWKLKIERKFPELDYVCTSQNRVWGCHYGPDGNGGVVNEIYASKLGDFKNWYSYDGTSQDSYAVSVGEDGAWTGCISYQGHPTFFKENAIIRVYGSYPAEYQLSINSARGVQKGSARSLAIVNEYLVYKSAADVVVYDGSNPVSISQALGRELMYYRASAGGTLGKYHISMQTPIGAMRNFVYDFQRNLWMREDSDVKFVEYTSTESGQIYARTDSEVYGIGANDNMLFIHTLSGEDQVKWWAESGDIGLEYADDKNVARLKIRAYIPPRAEIQVWVSYDDRPFEEARVIRGTGDMRSHVISLMMQACDHYRIRLKGHGDVRIYTMQTLLDTDGGDNE